MSELMKCQLNSKERKDRLEKLKISKPTNEEEAIELARDYMGCSWTFTIKAEHLIVCEGNANMARVLGQISFWHGQQIGQVDKGKKEYPENYKTDADFAAELYMKLKTFKDCKKKLIDLGVIRVETRGIPPISYYTYDKFTVREILARKLFPSVFCGGEPDGSSDDYDGGEFQELSVEKFFEESRETIGKLHLGEIRPINCPPLEKTQEMAQNIQLRQNVAIKCDIINHSDEDECKKGISEHLSTDLSTHPVDNYFTRPSVIGFLLDQNSRNGSKLHLGEIRPIERAKSAQIYKETKTPSKNTFNPPYPLLDDPSDQKIGTEETNQIVKDDIVKGDDEEKVLEELEENPSVQAVLPSNPTGTAQGVSRREVNDCIAFFRSFNHFGSYPDEVKNLAFVEVCKNFKTKAYGLKPAKGEIALKRTVEKLQKANYASNGVNGKEESDGRA